MNGANPKYLSTSIYTFSLLIIGPWKAVFWAILEWVTQKCIVEKPA